MARLPVMAKLPDARSKRMTPAALWEAEKLLVDFEAFIAAHPGRKSLFPLAREDDA